MSNQGNVAAGTTSLLTPTPATPGGGAHTPINANVVATVPLVNRVSIIESTAITRTREPLNDSNWSVWKGSMKHMFSLCNVTEYVFGAIRRPHFAHDPIGAKNWDFNDSYTAMLIYENILTAQKIHTGQDNTAYEVWRNLKVIHEITGHTTIITWIRTLFKCTAEEGDDILEHLSNLKTI